MTGSLRLGLLVSGFLHLAVAAGFSLTPEREPAVADREMPITLRLAAFQPPPAAAPPVPAIAPPPPQPFAKPEPSPSAEPQMAEPPRSVEPDPPSAPVVEQPPPAPVVKPSPPAQPPVNTAEPAPRPRLTAEPPASEPVRDRPRPKKAAKKPRTAAPRPEPAASPPAAPVRLASAEAKTAPPLDARATRHYLAALAARINRSKFYPRVSRRLGEEGRALVGFVIQRDGALTDVRIVESSGHRRLDDAALETVRRVTPFQPIPEVVGREQWPISVPIAFSLRP
jgi:protein TonB